MKTICLIADMVNSQEIIERKKIQEQLKEVLNQINGSSRQYLLSPYTITLGDEFQAVYSQFTTIIKDIINILFVMYPIQIRFSISYDELSTEINNEKALGMDGPAFYSARKNLEIIKREKKSIISLSEKDNPVFSIARSALNIFSNQLNRWNKTTVGCLYYLLADVPKKNILNEITKEVQVKERMIYKAISAYDLEEYKSELENITRHLNGCL